MEIIIGNLLDSKEKYIAHQANCVTTNSAGIAKLIFDKFPHSDVYSNRTSPDTPGSIKVMGNGNSERYVINMFSQYYPGKSKYIDSELDGILARQKYFHRSLQRIAKIENIESIALPWRIGCGLGGGDWEWYLGTIVNFSKYISDTQNAKCYIYKREGDE